MLKHHIQKIIFSFSYCFSIKNYTTILYSQSSPAPPALPPPPLLLLHLLLHLLLLHLLLHLLLPHLLLHLLLILHCSALHLTSASQQVAPDPAIGRLRPLGIYTVIQLYTSQYFSKVYFKIRYHL